MAAHLHAVPSGNASGKRVMPHSIDAEKTVVGGVLLHAAAFHQVAEHVAPEDFYDPKHQAIFQAMCDLDRQAKPIDPLTVAEQMRANDSFGKLRAVHGEAYFLELSEAVVTVDNIAFHAQMVRGKATVRRLIEASHEIAASGYGEHEDVQDYAARAFDQVARITETAARSRPEGLGSILGRASADIEKRVENQGSVTGVATGFKALDRRTTGFQPGELIVVAARPAMGKTALVMNAVQHAALVHGVPSLVFSLEMSKEALGERLLCGEARVESTRLRTGYLDTRDLAALMKARGRLHSAPIQIDDTSSPTLMEIRAKARRWRSDASIFKREGQLGVVVVDYLQLIASPPSKEENRQQQVAEISRGLKALSKEIRCPVVALSQLNRSVESRGDKRPMMSDLRESGAIEQDADVIAFIYRDEVYNKESPDKGVAEIILGKQRSGATGTVRLAFLGQYTRFENLHDDVDE